MISLVAGASRVTPGLTRSSPKRLRRRSILPGPEEPLAGSKLLAFGVERRILRPALAVECLVRGAALPAIKRQKAEWHGHVPEQIRADIAGRLTKERHPGPLGTVCAYERGRPLLGRLELPEDLEHVPSVQRCARSSQ